MTLKYESELLFDLMKRDGDDAPSDVLPYESELKEKYLEQVKGAYPKLQDYLGEWLNYNLYLQLPSQFPYESVANVTSASFDNVVPYAYKSAILKGLTLVNVVSSCRFTESTKYFGIELNNYKNNHSYMLIMFNVPNNIKRIYVGNLDGSIMWTDYTKNFIKNKNCIILKITCPSNYDGTSILPHFQYVDDERPSTINNIECMLIEYQDGMENWDIPYFEGMHSVKMPVLTISNGDGTKTNILTVNADVTMRSNGSVYDELDLLTGKLTQRIDEDGSVLTQEVIKTVDLTCINEHGESEALKPFEGTMHVSTSSQTLPPLLDMTVPVEATTQNLMSFANIVEGE